METEPVSWETAKSMNRAFSDVEPEHLGRGAENRDRAACLAAGNSKLKDTEIPGTSDLNEQGGRWFDKREQIQTEIKRGWECLEQVRRELAALHARLDEWPGYEVICGKNPLPDYMQAILAKERIEQYLPRWLKTREEQLRALDLQIKDSAKQSEVDQVM